LKIVIIKRVHTPWGTLGKVTIGASKLWSIEKPWNNNKPFESCIPNGSYNCERYSSEKYPDTFQVLEVPNRTHILFHAGNNSGDVQGCIALGKARSIYNNKIMVMDSQKAMRHFMDCMEGEDSFQLILTPFIPEYP